MPAYFKVEFPPQHIADRAYFEVDNHLPIPKTLPKDPYNPNRLPDPDANSSTEKPPDPPITERRISGPSRLVFEIGKNVIPFRLKDLLNWQLFDPVVSPLVLDVKPGEHPRPTTEPGPYLTAIEAPYRLLLSPGHDAGWSHLEQIEWDHKRTATQAGGATDKKPLPLCRYVEPVESKRTELWHTRRERVAAQAAHLVLEAWTIRIRNKNTFAPYGLGIWLKKTPTLRATVSSNRSGCRFRTAIVMNLCDSLLTTESKIPRTITTYPLRSKCKT